MKLPARLIYDSRTGGPARLNPYVPAWADVVRAGLAAGIQKPDIVNSSVHEEGAFRNLILKNAILIAANPEG